MGIHSRQWLQAGLMCVALTLAALGTRGICAETGPTTAPQVSAAEASRLARGREMRLLLVKLLDQIDADGGDWPEKLPSAEAERLSLVYSKPEKFGEPGLLNQQQVVVNERPERFSDGVWVGYADGHVEFARTPADLAACKDQLRIIRDSAGSYKNAWGPDLTVDPKSVAGKLGGSLTLRVIDPEGRPATDALVGIRSELGDDCTSDHLVYFDTFPNPLPRVTDSHGQVVLPAKVVFDPTGEGSLGLDFGAAPLVIMDRRRGLAALEEIPLADFSGGKTRTVQLQPACHVTGSLTSFGLEELKEPLGHTEGFAAIPGKVQIRALFFASSHGQIDMLVPPGDFGIQMDGHHCYPTTRYVHIRPSDRHLTLYVDLPSRPSASTLVGHPAPELREIKAWKNGGPVTLAQLHGKVIILDFWGYWCGVCTYGSMPELVKLYDRFKDRGLVIIAVHDDSVGSIAEMNQKLTEVRNKAWGGRDLPFLIALDGGGLTRIPGTGFFTRGLTNVEYHAALYPTTYLIGRDGTVLRELRTHVPNEQREIEKTIEELVNQTQ